MSEHKVETILANYQLFGIVYYLALVAKKYQNGGILNLQEVIIKTYNMLVTGWFLSLGFLELRQWIESVNG